MNTVFDIIKKGPEGCTPIDLENIKQILGNSVDINMQDSKGRTALAFCSCYYSSIFTRDTNIEIAKLLIENNADVSIQDKDGNTALIVASIYSTDSDIEFAKLILSRVKNSADVNIQNKKGNTAIMNASQCVANKTRSLKMSRLLLEYDARPYDMQKINILVNNIAKLNALS